MTEGDVLKSLEVVRTKFGHILESEAYAVLEEARAAVINSKKEHDERIRQHRRERVLRPWGYRVSPEKPLRFRSTKVRDLRLRVDLMCEALWVGEDDSPYSERLAIRVWSLDDHVMFRHELDAPAVKNRINPDYGRVMLRFHFDRASPGQHGPKYHLQVGGRAQPEECCWLHEGISVPRLAYPPIDLVLACEMIAADFFPDEYRHIRSDDVWKDVVKASQAYLLRHYYSTCLNVLNGRGRNPSLLDELWCTKWA